MDHIRNDIVQESLVVGDDDCRLLRSVKCVDAVGYNAQSIHIQSAVGLVKDGESRIEHGHLEYLVTLLLSSGEPYVYLSLCEFRLHLHKCHLLAKKLKEIACLERLETLACTMCIDGSLHEIRDGHTRYLHRILERKEYSCPCTLLRRHCKQVLSHELYRTGRNRKLRFAGKNCRQSTLACTVRTHHRMNLALADGQIDSFEDLLVLNRCPEAFYLQ